MYFYLNWYNVIYCYWNNVFGSSLNDFSIFIYRFVCFLTLLFLSKQIVLSQYWASIIPTISSILVAGRLPICCINIILLLGVDVKPMSQVPMASQYRPNISRQDIANANIANGNPILSQFGLTRERRRQWETSVGPIYIYVVWDRQTSIIFEMMNDRDPFNSELSIILLFHL